MRNRTLKSQISIFALAATLGLSACSDVGPHNVPTAVTAPSEDSLSGFNKAMHDLNKGLDRYIARPVAGAYKAVVPKPAKRGIGNVLKNLLEPWTAINEVLQLNFKGAWHTTKRFAVNTTVGIGGLWDQAKDMGLDRHSEDFGQTLAVWGVKPGPYVVLPIFGPSNLRDTVGITVDLFYEPGNYIMRKKGWTYESYGRAILDGINDRATYYDAVTDAFARPDAYDHLKLFYEQTRAFQIRNGLAAPDEVDDMFMEEPDCYPADEALEGDIVCEE